jgi:hypothetical protein
MVNPENGMPWSHERELWNSAFTNTDVQDTVVHCQKQYVSQKWVE